MESRGIGNTGPRRPVRAIPSTGQDCRVKRSVSTDPTVGSGSNIFHELPKAVFDGIAWNRKT